MNSFNQSIFAYGYLNNGLVYQKQGKFNKAIKEYNKAIEESPQYAAAFHNRGNAFQSLANFEEAIKDYSIAIHINPQYSAAFFNRALVYGKQGKFQEAIIDYTQFIQMVPENASAYNNRGNEIFQKKQMLIRIQEITMKQQQITQNLLKSILNMQLPIIIEVIINMYIFGNAYVNCGKFDEAIMDCSKALQLQRENADAFYIRANAYKNQGKYEVAIIDYSKALELNSKHAAAYYNRGLIFSDQQLYEKAIMDYSKAIELLPANPLYCFSLGFLYFSIKDLNQAYENFQKAIQLSLKVTPQERFQFQFTKDKIIFLLQKVEILTSIDKELQNVKEQMEYLLKSNNISEVYHQQYQSEITIIENLLGQFAPSKSKENQGEILQTLKLQMEKILNCKIEISKLQKNLSQDFEDQNYHLTQKNRFNLTENVRINLECLKSSESLNPKMNLYQHSLFWHLFNYLYIIDIIPSESFMINSKFDSEQILEKIQQNDNVKNSNEGFVPIISDTFGLINRALDFIGNIQEKRLQSRVFKLKQILQAFATSKSEYKREIEQASLYLMNNTKEDFERNQFNIFELFVEKISILEIDYEQYSESNFWKTGILHTLIILQYFDQNCQYIINQSSICTFKDIIVRSINEFNSESFAIEYIKQQ